MGSLCIAPVTAHILFCLASQYFAVLPSYLTILFIVVWSLSVSTKYYACCIIITMSKLKSNFQITIKSTSSNLETVVLYNPLRSSLVDNYARYCLLRNFTIKKLPCIISFYERRQNSPGLEALSHFNALFKP